MGKYRHIQNIFSVGLISESLEGRTDFPQYAGACKQLENYQVMQSGGAKRRVGTRFAHDFDLPGYASSGTDKGIFIPWYTADNEFVTIHIDINKTTNRATIIPYNIGPTYLGGGTASTVSAVKPPASTGYNFLGDNESTYDVGKNSRIHYQQYGTFMIVTCSSGKYAPVIFLKSGSNYYVESWQHLRTLSATYGYTTTIEVANAFPFIKDYSSKVSLTASWASPNTILIASGGVFTSNLVGSFVRIESTTLTAIMRISAYISATEVRCNLTATIFTTATISSITGVFYDWAFSSWNDRDGYPTKVSFFEERLFLGNSTTLPHFVWGSMSQNAFFFNELRAPQAPPANLEFPFYGVHVSDDPLSLAVGSDNNSPIQWLSPDSRLLIGTFNSESSADGGDSALSQEMKKIRMSDTKGSIDVRPIRADRATIFVGMDGRTIYRMGWRADINGYECRNLNILYNDLFSDTLTSGVIAKMAFNNSAKIVWVISSAGELASLTLNDEAQIIAWAKHPLAGTTVKVRAVSSHVYSPPGQPDIIHERTYFLVERTIDGVVELYCETFTDTVTDYVDCAFSDLGASATVWGGFDHLIGETIQVKNDAGVWSDLVVNGSGEITFPAASLSVLGGYHYDSVLETLPMDVGASKGSETAQGSLSRIDRTITKVHQSQGGSIGFDETKLIPLLGTPVGNTLISKDAITPFPQGPDRKTKIIIKQTTPHPLTILAIISRGVTYD